jgi:cyclopropane fatty-acyl-phospholipid synthase-like methyltransferase
MLKPTYWRKLRAQREPSSLGYPDFFNERHKRKMFELANLRPSDVFYDLGCGDASVLIFAVKEFGVRKAVGFESEPRRNAKARQR